MKIKLKEIKLPANWRVINQAKVKEIAASFEAIGQLNDVGINQDWTLVYGMHRFLAAQSLGWDEIEGKVVDTADAIKLELANIDENVCRNPLTPIELAIQVKRQLELYTILNPNTAKHGGDRTSDTTSATKTIAEKTGLGGRTIRRYKFIAENLKGDVTGEYEFKVGELQQLATLPKADQEYINTNIVAGGLHEGDFEAAFNAVKPKEAAITTPPIVCEQVASQATCHLRGMDGSSIPVNSPGAFTINLPSKVYEQYENDENCPPSVIASPSIAEQIRLKQQGITEVPPAIIKKQLHSLITQTQTAIKSLKDILKTINASEDDLQLIESINEHVLDLINVNYEEN
jgi:hypothetical protein